MKRLRAVYGAGGCGRGIMPLVAARAGGVDEMAFVDDGCATDKVNGYPVLTWEDFLSRKDEKLVAIAIADSNIREALECKRQTTDVELMNVVATNAVIMDDVLIGQGCLISPFVTITSNVRIGLHFHCNIASYVEHDCVIGDYVTFAPGVRCNGNVHIGDHAYIGSGAIIKQGTGSKPLRIGRGAIIGMGAVVTKDVAPGATVVGNPAREIARKG